jgi:23S rRNA (pseudouridine1915-N3)-methyltransferase
MRIVAVGSRMPKWVREPFDDYLARLGSTLKISLTEIEPGSRTAGKSPARAVEIEGDRILSCLRADEFVVALDERGTQMTTREFSAWLSARLQDGSDMAFLIGGADGFAPEVLRRSNFKWSLSRLTFPHALVRVLLAEHIYRAHGVLSNHPYHRD